MNKREFIERLQTAWEKCPDYTFTEFVQAIWDREDNYCDLFDIAEDVFLAHAEEFANATQYPHTVKIEGSFSGVKTVVARDKFEAHCKVFDMTQDELSSVGLDMEEFESTDEGES